MLDWFVGGSAVELHRGYCVCHTFVPDMISSVLPELSAVPTSNLVMIVMIRMSMLCGVALTYKCIIRC